GICFIGKINVGAFLREKIKAVAGEVVTTTGQVVGKHDGLPFYTIGQREGIGIGGTGPYYVVNKDFSANQLVVTNEKNHPDLWKKDFEVADLYWTNGQPKNLDNIAVSIRYHHPEYAAVLLPVRDKMHVHF